MNDNEILEGIVKGYLLDKMNKQRETEILDKMILNKKYIFELYGYIFCAIKFKDGMLIEIENHRVGIRNINDFEDKVKNKIFAKIEEIL